MKKNEAVLKEVLKDIEPSEEDLRYIKKQLSVFSKDIKEKIKKNKIKAEIFVGGSFAKGTVIKKKNYDVDIFIRFDKQYDSKDISNLTKKILSRHNPLLVHGSRDYFIVYCERNFCLELVPVKKLKNLKEYENITDLSYLHVKYIHKKIKNKKILDEIKIAKAFCYANNCYGAESYINGFSGYSLELLVYYYKSFMNFVKAMSKISLDKKEIIDIEKHFKNKKEALLDLNSAKLNSPIILIDPTFKQRNALAALSKETFEKFSKVCKEFVKNPDKKFFEQKKVDLDKLKEGAIKKGEEFILLEASTNKPIGDIAGSKLKKFYNYLEKEIEKFFIIKNKGFNYNGKSSARYFFIVQSKKEVLFSGPFTDDKENCHKFKLEHRDVFEKEGKLFAREKIKFDLKEFIEKWKLKSSRIIKEMYITNFLILN